MDWCGLLWPKFYRTVMYNSCYVCISFYHFLVLVHGKKFQTWILKKQILFDAYALPYLYFSRFPPIDDDVIIVTSSISWSMIIAYCINDILLKHYNLRFLEFLQQLVLQMLQKCHCNTCDKSGGMCDEHVKDKNPEKWHEFQYGCWGYTQ